jgi:N-acetylglutamate synthase-like GNAT family acetyltransferase
MPPQFVAFRTATADDAPAIVALLRDTCKTSSNTIANDNYNDRFDILTLGDTLVGVLQSRIEDDHLWLEKIAIHPHHRQRGHGSALMLLADQIARQRGLPAIRILRPDGDAVAAVFLDQLGYEPCGQGASGGQLMERRLALGATQPSIRSAHGWTDVTRSTARGF